MKFICIQTCFTDSLVPYGATVEYENEDAIHPSVRPFFKQKSVVDAENKEKEENTLSPEEEIELLQKECDELGFGYDRRWGKGRLEQEIQKFKVGMTGASPNPSDTE